MNKIQGLPFALLATWRGITFFPEMVLHPKGYGLTQTINPLETFSPKATRHQNIMATSETTGL